MQTLLHKATFALLLILSLDIDLDDRPDLEIAGADGSERVIVWLNDGHGRLLEGESRGYGRIHYLGLRSLSSIHSEASESCDPGTDRDIAGEWLHHCGWALPDRSEPVEFYSRTISSG